MKMYHFLAVVLIISITLPEATQASPSDLLLIAIDSIKSQILLTYPKCSHLTFLYESHVTSNIHQHFDGSTTNLVIDLSFSTPNMNEPSQIYQYEHRYFYRHHQPCAVVLYEVDSNLLQNVHVLNNGTIGQRWPERILTLLPSSVFNSFFIFFTNEIHRAASLLPAMSDLMGQTAMFLNALFSIPNGKSELNIFSGFPQISHQLQLVATVRHNDSKVLDATRIYRKEYNFEGAPFTTSFCTACTTDYEKLELVPGTGIAFHWAWILTLIHVNATPLVETVFDIPENGLTDEGDFDDFLLPLLDGTAAMTSILIPTPETYHLVYTTRAYWLDSMCFMTALPARDTSAGLSLIIEPLDWTVWVAIIVTSMCLLGCLELIMISNGRKITFNLHLWLTDMISCPMLSQGGFDDQTFRQRANDSCKMHLMVGLWAVALIVLNGVYTSVLWDVIGYPRFRHPPRTLDELDESDYEIGFVFNVDRDLTATNSSRNLRLAERLVEHDFTYSSCYQGVFERRMACMGYYTAFAYIGFEYMVDIYGRMLAEISKERKFFKVGAAGVSKYYPMLLEPMNHYLTVVESSGLGLHGWNYLESLVKKKGRRNAEYYVHKKKYYAGSSGSLEKSDDEQIVVAIVLGVLRAGFVAAAIVFLCEYAIHTKCLGHLWVFVPWVYILSHVRRKNSTSVERFGDLVTADEKRNSEGQEIYVEEDRNVEIVDRGVVVEDGNTEEGE